jgi:hypothetical protein
MQYANFANHDLLRFFVLIFKLTYVIYHHAASI